MLKSPAQFLPKQAVNGDFVLPKTQATNDPSSIGNLDLVLVAVKTWQVPDTASAIKPMVGEHTMVLPLLNGVEAVPRLTAKLYKRFFKGFSKIFPRGK